MSDIAFDGMVFDRLREIGDQSQRIGELEREIERLRLTDEERDDLRVWLAECLRQASTATEGGNEELAERWQGRAKRAAARIAGAVGESDIKATLRGLLERQHNLSAGQAPAR